MELAQFHVGHEGREVFWNAQHFEPFLFLFTFFALLIFAYGIYRRWLAWSAIGKEDPENRTDNLSVRIKNLLINGLLQKRYSKISFRALCMPLSSSAFWSSSSGRPSMPRSST